MEVTGEEEDVLMEDGKDEDTPGRCVIETSACGDTGTDIGVECFMRWKGARVAIRRTNRRWTFDPVDCDCNEGVLLCQFVRLGVHRVTLSKKQGVKITQRQTATAKRDLKDGQRIG